MTESEAARELMKRVNRMNLLLIDNEYRSKHLQFYGTALDEKYIYRNLIGDHVYSIEYLLNRNEYEITYDDGLQSHLKGNT